MTDPIRKALAGYLRCYESVYDCVDPDTGTPYQYEQAKAAEAAARAALAEQPSVREPLTDEQITRVWFESASGKITPTHIEFARAIEAKHGIGVKGEA